MLQVQALQAHYGTSPVLRGLDFEVRPGEIVALLGRNGSGRSTTAKAIMGLVQWGGQLLWNGAPLAGKRTFEVARAGIGYVPENRDVFPRLTVHQNLLLGQKAHKASAADTGYWTVARVYEAFPLLAQRRQTQAGVLSGGEQQLLSLCRALVGNPQLLIVDEPAEGLAPQPSALVADTLLQLRARGTAVLLVEQKLAMALAVSDRVLVLGHGSIVFRGTPAQLLADDAVRRQWLEV